MMKTLRLLFILAVSLGSLAACTPAAGPEATDVVPETEIPSPEPTEAPAAPRPTSAPICTAWNPETSEQGPFFWWNETVFYEIFVRSFLDGDGDGIGDFNGITQKLDYLNDGDDQTDSDLGISGIWLMPINPSPSYHGYDVTDYFAVNPEYGSMEDFRRLLDEAHSRGIRVIMDLVLNHTSTRHPWFEDASTEPDSIYRDYYIFTESPGGFDSPWGTEVWHKADTGFYYGIFWAGMPDLNYTNPQVVAEMQQVVRFWLEDVGVDGFRLDAIKHMIEDGAVQENTPATHAFWEAFHDYYTGINPQALAVGEAWTSTQEVVKYIGDEVNIAFEFDNAAAIIESARTETNIPISDSHALVLNSYPPHQYATFLSNHDQTRAMTVFRGEVGKAKSAASLLLTGPGVPFLYYGEEVGQRGSKPDENLRAPMQWSAETYAGFTTADLPWRFPERGFEDANVAVQDADPDSLLNHYRTLIQARNRLPALQSGGMLQLPVADRGVYAFLRYLDDQVLLVVVNLTDEPIEDYSFCLSSGALELGSAVELLGQHPVKAPTLNSQGGFDNYRPIETLEPYTTYVIELR